MVVPQKSELATIREFFAKLLRGSIAGQDIYGWWRRALAKSVSTMMGKPCRNTAPRCTRPA